MKNGAFFDLINFLKITLDFSEKIHKNIELISSLLLFPFYQAPHILAPDLLTNFYLVWGPREKNGVEMLLQNLKCILTCRNLEKNVTQLDVLCLGKFIECLLGSYQLYKTTYLGFLAKIKQWKNHSKRGNGCSKHFHSIKSPHQY